MTKTVPDPFQMAADRYWGPVYKSDPVAWCRDKLGVHLWSGQQRVARSVVENRYTAVRSAHDQGKSFEAACMQQWWIDVHPVGEAFAVTTAPGAAQVEAILWREIGKLHRKAKGKLKGRITFGGYPQQYIGQELVSYGRKPADYDQTAFQGIHARYVLIIIDEADGVPKALFDAVDALATNINARVLAIGNPDNPSSHFASVCKPGSGWNVIELDGLRSPNFREQDVRPYPELAQYMEENGIPYSTEEVPEYIRDLLLSPIWVWERMRRWGVVRNVDEETGEPLWETPALWQSKVRGRFPEDGTEGVIPLSWVEQAMVRWEEWKANGGDLSQVPGRRVYGLDVSRFGDDETVVATRQGDCVGEIESWGRPDTMTSANRLAARLDQVPQSTACVDVIGVGGGVVDRLRELGKRVIAFNASATAGKLTDSTGEFTFPNARSAAWWHLREVLDPNKGSRVMLPRDEMLLADLTAPKWSLGTGAKLVVEPKENTRKRLGRSPDYGDSVVIAFHLVGATDGDGVVMHWDDVPTSRDTYDAELEGLVASAW